MSTREYGFTDAQAALEVSKKAQGASERMESLSVYLGKKVKEIEGLTETFSVQTQVANRLKDVIAMIKETVEPLSTIAKDIQITAQRSIEALEVSKNARI